MTTERFIQIRTEEVRSFFRLRFGRPWRRRVAQRLKRKDVPRWLISRKYPPTLAKIIPVERLAFDLGYRCVFARSATLPRKCPLDGSSHLVIVSEDSASQPANNH